MADSYVIKADLGLKAPETHVLSFATEVHNNYFYGPSYVAARGKETMRRDFSSVREAIHALVEEDRSLVDGKMWHSDNFHTVIPEQSKSLEKLKTAIRRGEEQIFSYWKLSDDGSSKVPVLVQGKPRRIDHENGLLKAESKYSESTKSYRLEEIGGIFPQEINTVITVNLLFEPLKRGRTKVTVSSAGRYRLGKHRKGGEKKSFPLREEIPSQGVSSQVTLAGNSSVWNAVAVGELFELVAPNGDKLALRVESVNSAENGDAHG